MNDYQELLKSKIGKVQEVGFNAKDLNANLFDFQKYIVEKACKMGRYAIFAENFEQPMVINTCKYPRYFNKPNKYSAFG